MEGTQAMRRMTFAERTNVSRKEIKDVAATLRRFIDDENAIPHASAAESDGTNRAQNERRANLMLAYRHLEDASSRLGKALQADDGGVSVYDRKTTVDIADGAQGTGLRPPEQSA